MTDQDSLFHSRRFTGKLAAGARQLPISFNARLQDTGAIALEMDHLPFHRETHFILQHQQIDDPFPYFHLSGTSDDGTNFSTDELFFISVGPNFNEHQPGPYYVFNARCNSAHFHKSADQAIDRPMLMLHIKGFESYRPLKATHPVGSVAMVGDDGKGDVDLLSGHLAIEAIDVPDDASRWHDEAKAVLEHVRRVMSFAAGTNVGAPVIEFRSGADIHVAVHEPTKQHRGELPSMNRMERQPIFEVAVRSYSTPAIEVENLSMVMEWLSMPTTYNETRLINVMTALENLVDSNIGDDDQLLEKTLAKKLRKAVSAVFDEFIHEQQLADAFPDLKTELQEKLSDLNRRSLKRKIDILAKRWSIPMCGLEDQLIRDSKKARDHVVHKGRYYVNGTQQTNLWVHVSVIRELMTRIILTVLGYRGEYISYLGSTHHAIFPPVTSEETEKDVQPTES